MKDAVAPARLHIERHRCHGPSRAGRRTGKQASPAGGDDERSPAGGVQSRQPAAAQGRALHQRRARRDGGSWQADVTLAGVAHRLAGLGRVDAAEAFAVPVPGQDDVADLLGTMRTPVGELRYVRPPGTIGGVAPMWESPTPFPIPPLTSPAAGSR